MKNLGTDILNNGTVIATFRQPRFFSINIIKQFLDSYKIHEAPQRPIENLNFCITIHLFYKIQSNQI